MDIEVWKKNVVPKCLENHDSEWLKLESRNLVPREEDAAVHADRRGVERKLIQVNTSRVKEKSEVITLLLVRRIR